jgi:hypothetical protein
VRVSKGAHGAESLVGPSGSLGAVTGSFVVQDTGLHVEGKDALEGGSTSSGSLKPLSPDP